MKYVSNKNARGKRLFVASCLQFVAILLLFSVYTAKAMNDGSRYAKNSVLSSGKWVQLQVTENAVYKLTYDDIKKMGFNDPAKIKVYGYGGWLLNEDFTKPYIDDLPEVSVWMNKGADGIFNAGDYLLFYGRGTVKWSCDTKNEFVHEINHYTTYGSYFITENDAGPKIMEELPSYSGAVSSLNTFDDYALHEKDESYILTSGRELFGESFTGKNSQNFTFSIPGITADPGIVRVSFVSSTSKDFPATLSLSVNNVEYINFQVASISGEYEKASLNNRTGIWSGEKNESSVVNITYTASNQSAAYLNYIRLNMKRRLQFYDTGYTFFRNVNSKTSDVKYVIENAGNQSLVWDVTENFDVKTVETSRNGNTLSFNAQKNSVLREYVMIDYSKAFPSPTVAGEIKNQNLHATQQIDMAIIVPEVYIRYAELLAEQHRKTGLKVIVVQPEWIYNEFSSGNPDATAYRRFMKMFYDRAETENEKPKYLLLFGDGIFDNRHLSAAATKMDPRYYLLTYQMVESTNETYSYGTDDYFGFLDDNEGVYISRDGLDLGVGRFPVSSTSQAENAVNKVIGYMNNNLYSDWKNRLILTADDADNNVPTHMRQSNDIASYIETNHPQYMITKSYMDAFNPFNLNGKKTYPDAKKKFFNALKEGCLLLNYTGHGSISAWSGEDMLNVADVRQMDFEGLPLWITATCDFGWYDAITTSGGEEAFLNKKSAAIALFTTTRVVYSENNYRLNNYLIRNLFSFDDNNNPPRLGDVLRKSKNSMGSDANKLNYVLLGDPALSLSYPKLNVKLEKINGESVNENETCSFRALDKIVMEGNIVDGEGNIVSNFNGNLKTSVFDSKQMIVSHARISDTEFFSFSDYPNKIFTGNSQVKDGKFSVSFTVPFDISYNKDNGKINFYANDITNGMDANGFYTKYMLAGSSNAEYETTPPEITKMFLNSESFVSGGDVNETPFFVAGVFDKTGINITGNGLGRDITICIDNSPKHFYSLNDYFIPQNETGGEIKFPIPELAPGRHILKFKVWNILNISATDSLSFNVVKGLKPKLYDITATNIPARDFTNFRLTHDRPESIIDVEILVYDLTGREVWSHKEAGSSSWQKQYEVEWNLTNNAGRRIEEGVYIYKAVICSSEGKEATKAKKIIVLKQ
ncbi:MAG: type IX secretion system sortase PorU [Dysgonamonadaceae bacterium]|jgi:hypothetical protein|nr:type IX secretion system sortase PorU [Dysgonamonadaceae bacterium]